MTDHTDPMDPAWRETVRDLYDLLHFGPESVFTGSALAQEIVTFIEARHPGFFTPPHRPPP